MFAPRQVKRRKLDEAPKQQSTRPTPKPSNNESRESEVISDYCATSVKKSVTHPAPGEKGSNITLAKVTPEYLEQVMCGLELLLSR